MDQTWANIRISEIADACVKCGQCLPQCPTYRLHGHEAQSPRGRLALLQHATQDEAPLDGSAAKALSQCLSCGQCERHCPLHLPFTEALDLHRSARAPSVSWSSRIIGSPWLLTMLMTWLRWLPKSLLRLLPHPELLVALQERSKAAPLTDSGPDGDHAAASTLCVLPGCVGTQWDRTTLNAIARIAHQRGMSPQVLPSLCCGGLARHQGRADTSDTLTSESRATLADRISTPLIQVDSGCRAAWQQILPQHRVLDAIEWIDSLNDLHFRRSTETIAIHWPCTATDRQRDALRRQVRRVPGLRWRELVDHAGCCGAGGDAFLREPAQSRSFLESWLADWSSAQEPIILSMNIGCSVHLAGSIESFRATMNTQAPSKTIIEHPAAFLARHLETVA